MRPSSFTFGATDAGSGVAAIWAAVDDGLPVQVGAAAGGSLEITVPADHSFDGAHTLHYYSTDVAGNTETAQVAQLKIDTTAPAVAVRAAAGYTGRAVLLSFRVRDQLSPTARELSLVVTDAAGETVATAALGAASTGDWHRARWTPHAAGDYHYAVAAADLAGNAAASGLRCARGEVPRPASPSGAPSGGGRSPSRASATAAGVC